MYKQLTKPNSGIKDKFSERPERKSTKTMRKIHIEFMFEQAKTTFIF
jgi:hypothetical protein